MQISRPFYLFFLILLPWLASAQGIPVSEQVEEIAFGFLQNGLEAGDEETVVRLSDSTLKAKLPPAQLLSIWKNLKISGGALKSWEEMEVWPYGSDLYQARCQAELENSTLAVTLIVDPCCAPSTMKVKGIFFKPGSESSNPPPYADTRQFSEEKLVLQGDEYPLPGKLTLPVGEKKVPLVILVHGSGPQDMDVSIGPNKMFRDLAWGLSSQGIAVYRYDKRTLYYAGKIMKEQDSLTVHEETIADALRAIQQLKMHPRVDPDRIVVLGHSLGAMAAPKIADLAGGQVDVALLAAPFRPLEDLILEQTHYLMTLEDDSLSEREAKKFAELRAQCANVKALLRGKEVAKEDLPFGFAAPYWRSVNELTQKQVYYAARSRRLLMLQGDRDYQVTKTKDFHAWERSSFWDVHPDANKQTFWGLNHLFMVSKSPRPDPADYKVRGHVHPKVISVLANWILAAD